MAKEYIFQVLGLLSSDIEAAREGIVFYCVCFVLTGVIVGLAMFLQVSMIDTILKVLKTRYTNHAWYTYSIHVQNRLLILQIAMLSAAAEGLTLRLRKMVFESMLNQEMAWFDDPKNSTGALCTRISHDTGAVSGVSIIHYVLPWFYLLFSHRCPAAVSPP